MISTGNLWLAFFASLAIGLAWLSDAAAEVVVFRDTFDRPANGDLDASGVGMSGVAGPLSYYERSDNFLANGTDAVTNVENNQLHLADGPNATVTSLDFNFFSPSTTGLSISLDLVSNDGNASDGPQRFIGFGLGASAEEAAGAAYDNNATASAPGWKGHQNGTTAGSGFADFYVAWERNSSASQNNFGRIAIWKDGLRTSFFTNDGSLYPIGSTLRVDLSFADFNAGTTVNANVFYGDSLVTTDTFAWDHTNENYIGFSGRQNNAGWTADNFQITANDFTISPPEQLPTLVINRDTGNVSLVNNLYSPIEIAGYSIETSGGFDTDEWVDQPGLERNLTVVSNPSKDLSEGTFGLSGVTIPSGGVMDLGDAWVLSPFEDFSAEFLLADSSLLDFEVVVTGNDGNPYALGDFDVDGDLDPTDWETLRSNLNTTADESGVLAYRVEGDMNLDGTIDGVDKSLFAAAYDAANGAGAFDQLQVPEPSAAAISLLALAASLAPRRHRAAV